MTLRKTYSLESYSPRIDRQRGYATATVVLVMLISLVGGAFLLKRVKNQASVTGGYYQARSATLAAQAGLTAGLMQFETDPNGGVYILNAYVADTTKQWLLGTAANTGTKHQIVMGNGLQSYAARISDFDPKTHLIKIEGQGSGPGGSQSVAYGVYQMGGIASLPTVMPKYAWFMAGEARNVDQAVDVTGEAYFGGGVHFNAGANGSVMRGAVKIAKGTNLESTFDALVTFMDKTYVQTPFKSQGGGVQFQANAGFETSINIDKDPLFTGSGLTGYFNGNVSLGNANFQMGGNKVIHSGSLNTARIKNASTITNKGSVIDIAGALGMTAAAENEITVDVTQVPASKRYTFSSLGIGSFGNVTGADLTAGYNAAKASGKLYNDFLVILVTTSMNFSAVSPNVLSGKFLFEVTSSVNVNGNLPDSDPSSVCLWHFNTGASVNGFGGGGLFRGYINVTGTASVIYQWKAGAEFRGAVHHVSTASGFQMNGSAGPLKLVVDGSVFEDLDPLGVLAAPSGAAPAPMPTPPPGAPPVVAVVKLFDMKIRPFMFSRWF